MRRVLATTTLTLLLAVVPLPTDAIFMQVFIDTVPVRRVIANLTEQVQARPEDARAHWALGRAHAMAASDPSRSVEVTRKAGELWFGYTPKYAPFAPVASKSEATRQHLELAISHHQKALALEPPMAMAIQLGLGWCLEQAGRRSEAIAAYRTVVGAAWPLEGKLTSGPIGGNTLVAEAAGYLIPLLDPVADRAEVTELEARAAKLESLPVPITPVAVDLSGRGDPSALIDAAARVRFDLDGRGRAGQWQWLTPSAAWLVWDPKASGRITSGTQLFGAVTFLMFWRTGYEALATLDDDGNGWLEGRELTGLALWHDRDGDGTSQDGEVTALATAGIVGVATRPQPGTSPAVAAKHDRGVRYADGTTRPTFDLVLAPARPLPVMTQNETREER